MIIPPGFAQVNLRYRGACAPLGAENVFGVSNTGALTGQAIADVVEAAYNTRIRPQTAGGLNLFEIAVKLGPNGVGPSFTKSVNLVGPGNGPYAPPSITFLMQKSSARGGRGSSGRWYLPGVAEAQVADDGTILLAQRTALDTAFDQFLDDLTAGGVPMFLLSSKPAIEPAIVLSIVTDLIAGSQRARMRR